MNIQEILEDSDLLVQNAFPNARKIGWFNQIQRQLYRDMPNSFSSPPQDIKEEQMTFVPRFSLEYHELFVLGIAIRMAERNNDFKTAAELQMRYQALLGEAKEKLASKVSKVTIKRSWI